MNLLTKAYRDGWRKERKLHMIWRAIARRHLSRVRTISALEAFMFQLPNDGETDP